jgi:CYTH domain-containing protein
MAQKYSLPELERRWLVREGAVPALASASRRIIEDKYIQGGRLRLRAVFADGSEPIYKLGKKYGRDGTEPEQVVSVYLTEQEYGSLLVLPGANLRKVRYGVEGGSLDVLECPSPGLAIFEVEFQSQSAAEAYIAPAFVGEEVTFSANYSGYALAHTAL